MSAFLAHTWQVAVDTERAVRADYRRKRRAIRDALAEAGLAARMDALVARLLDG